MRRLLVLAVTAVAAGVGSASAAGAIGAVCGPSTIGTVLHSPRGAIECIALEDDGGDLLYVWDFI